MQRDDVGKLDRLDVDWIEPPRPDRHRLGRHAFVCPRNAPPHEVVAVLFQSRIMVALRPDFEDHAVSGLVVETPDRDPGAVANAEMTSCS